MFSHILIAALVGAAYAGPVNNSLLKGGRIYGGVNTEIEKFPYQVSLEYYNSHSCGGSIINEFYVLTAAHCVDGRSAQRMTIRAGSTYSESGGTVYQVERIIKNEKYYTNMYGVPRNDVALLLLADAIDFDSTKQPIDLFQVGEKSLAGTDAVISGWGNTEYGETDHLKTTTVPIVDYDLCNKVYKSAGGVPVGQICAGYYKVGGKDTCQGDSGGPLTIGGRLAGIVSWGSGCADPNFPGAYTEVAYYRPWIMSHMIRKK